MAITFGVICNLEEIKGFLQMAILIAFLFILLKTKWFTIYLYIDDGTYTHLNYTLNPTLDES